MQAVLGSWKEIATYLGKGVRTVQRWERCSGLPIHRPSGTSKGVVLAFPAELDKWARRQDAGAHASARLSLERNSTLTAELCEQTHQLRARTRELVKQTTAFMEMAKRRRGEPQNGDGNLPLPKAEEA
jgi:hypothetical protein